MDESFGSWLKHAWNAFMNRSPTYRTADHGASYSYRPDRPRLTRGNERSIITSVYNRIAMDVAAISIQHVRLDANGRFLSAMDSGLNRCLTLVFYKLDKIYPRIITEMKQREAAEAEKAAANA